MTLRLALLVVAATTAATTAGCDPGSYEDFRSQLADRSCERAIACGEVAPDERFLCSAPADVLALLGRDDFDIRTALAAGHLEFVPSGATRCLEAVASAPCEEGAAGERILLGCNNVVHPSTPVGNACWSDRQCEGGRCARASYACPGRCDGWLPLGATCVDGDPNRSCDPTVHYCGTTAPPDAGTGEEASCLRKKQRGEKCLSDVECSFGLVCTGESCGDLPHPREGDPCAASTLCDREVYCAPTGICVKQLSAGQACDSPLACGRGLACIGLRAATATTPLVPGVCGPWLTTGAACDPTVTVSGCTRSQSCWPTTGICTPNRTSTPRGYGEACVPRDGMSLNTCAPWLACLNGACTDASGRGAKCTTAEECRPDIGLECIAGTCATRATCQ